MIQECSISGLRNFNVRMKWNLYHFRLTQNRKARDADGQVFLFCGSHVVR